MNNRHLERKELVYFPKILNCNDDSELGRIVDVTVEGFLVISDTEMKMEPNSAIKIKVLWTDEFGKESFLTCQTEVRWCKEDVNPENTAIGLSITDISDKDKEKIKRLMRKWGFPSWQ